MSRLVPIALLLALGCAEPVSSTTLDQGAGRSAEPTALDRVRTVLDGTGEDAVFLAVVSPT